AADRLGARLPDLRAPRARERRRRDRVGRAAGRQAGAGARRAVDHGRDLPFRPRGDRGAGGAAVTVAVARTLDEELTDPRFVDDPYRVYARLRVEDPVHWCEPWRQWVVTRFDDV